MSRRRCWCPWDWSIRWKLMFWICLPLIVVYAVTSVLEFRAAHTEAIRSANDRLVGMAQRYASDYNNQLVAISSSSQTLATLLTAQPQMPRPLLHRLMKSQLIQHPKLSGCYVGFACDPSKTKPSAGDAPVALRQSDAIVMTNSGADRQYLSSDWYLIPARLRQRVWTEPYYDPTGRKAMAACSVPFYRWDDPPTDRSVHGVVSQAVGLESLQSAVRRIRVPGGYAFLISHYGRFLAHEDSQLIMNWSIYALSDWHADPQVAALGHAMTRGQSGAMPITGPLTISGTDAGERKLVAYAPLANAGWSLAIVMDEDQVMSPVYAELHHFLLLRAIDLFLLLVIVWLVAWRITQPIQRLCRVAGIVAEGDLVRAKQVNEAIGRAGSQDSGSEPQRLQAAIGQMIYRLASLVGRVKESGIQLISATHQITAASREQNRTVGEFGQSTQQIAAAVAEISATSRELVQTMQQVNQAALSASSLADGSKTHLVQLSEDMDRLQQSTGAMTDRLDGLHQRAADIGVVIVTMTRIADQTNLLSVNAAVEAEKAGEHGRGFLVVSREIQRLADQTASATLDVEALVRQMQREIAAAVNDIQQFASRVSDSVSRSSAVAGELGEVIDRVASLTPGIESVTEGMDNQSRGAEQIREAMTRLNDGAQRTADALEEFGRAAIHLKEAVDVMAKEVGRFRIGNAEAPALSADCQEPSEDQEQS